MYHAWRKGETLQPQGMYQVSREGRILMDAWRWVAGEFATMKDLYLMLRREEVVKQEVFYQCNDAMQP
jgi:hypothetical protein